MAHYTGCFRLGDDARLAHTQDQTPVVNMALASNYGMKDQASGKRPTTWIDVSFWGARAEALAPYLVKGGSVYAVIRDVHLEQFTRRDQTVGFKLVGTIIDIELVSSPQQSAPQQPAQQHAQRPAQNQQRQPPQRQPAPARSFDDFEDDIPFASCAELNDPILSRHFKKEW